MPLATSLAYFGIKFPLFPLRIPHKGKNKGKYISFHYLRGWKACKIRKVQEISPQIPICLLSFYNGWPIVFNSLYMFERNSSIKLFIISGLSVLEYWGTVFLAFLLSLVVIHSSFQMFLLYNHFLFFSFCTFSFLFHSFWLHVHYWACC